MATPGFRGGPLALLASLVLLSVGFAFSEAAPDSETPPEPPPQAANTELAVILMRAGLAAEVLCAAGITADSVTGLLSPIDAQIDALPNALPNIDQAFAQARVVRDRLRRLVRSGRGTAGDVAALAQARHTFQTAKAARTSFFENLRAVLVGSVPQDMVPAFQRMRRNSGWKLPTQYLIVDREETQWIGLREALAVKRISENYDEDFPEDVQGYLASIDAVPAIAAAKVNLDTHLAAVQIAWNLAVAD